MVVCPESEIVLGISNSHDSGAAILKDGRIIAAVNEERFSRKKCQSGFPRESILSLLRQSEIRPEQIDAVGLAGTIGGPPPLNNDFRDDSNQKKMAQLLAEAINQLPGGLALLKSRALNISYRRSLVLRRKFSSFKVYREQLDDIGIYANTIFHDHHDSHLAAAGYGSSIENAVVISNDGFGDGVCSKVGIKRDGKLTVDNNSSNEFVNSVGVLYNYATLLCGFPRVYHAGKTTGLAAHGDSKITKGIFADVISWNSKKNKYENRLGIFDVARKYLTSKLARFSAADIAAGAQALLEDVITEQVRHYVASTGIREVILVGGVHANVKLNQIISELPEVEAIDVFPNMGDGGLPVGAAFLSVSDQERISSDGIRTLFLGPEDNETEIQSALQSFGADLKWNRPLGLAQRCAGLLAQGFVVAHFDGRMEYGPRALGNRSILCSARDSRMNDYINQALGRTEFMPFAPIVRDCDLNDYFHVDYSCVNRCLRFMTITCRATERCRSEAPAVVHIDGTARPQVVDKDSNPKMYKILTEFKRVSGESLLINTSFNMHGEPIVCTPKDALKSFRLSGLHAMVIGPFLVERN